MARRIVFIGNCQMSILRNLYDRFVTGVTDDDTYFLPTWTALDGQGAAALESADLLVDQVQSFSSEAIERPARIASIPRVPVPLVSATFLWPFAGSAHPLNADSPHLSGGPYPGELGDGFLNRMIKDEVSPEVALERYRQHDLGGPAALDRRYEIVMYQQRQRDAVCGYTVAGEIESRFRREPLFLSPHHPRQQITMVLAQQCLARIGAPQRSIDMLTRNMPGFLFPQDEQPIHPAVARHFGLAYINNETLYAWRGEGRFSFDEWVLRYMRYTWSPALFEGCRAVASDPLRSRAILSEVTERLPRSPLAKAGLAKACLALRDLEPAAAHIAAAIEISPNDPDFLRAAAFIASGRGRRDEAVKFAGQSANLDGGNSDALRLLARLQEDAGNLVDAEKTRRKLLDLRPDDAEAWSDLGTVLSRLNRSDNALACYRKAISLGPTLASGYFGASCVLAHLGRIQEAALAAEHAIARRPGVSAYLSHLGHLLSRLGRPEDAIDAMSRALEHDPCNAGIHNFVADVRLKSDHLSKQGLYHACRAADCAPEVASYQVKVAQLLTRHLRLVEAIEAYERAIGLQPRDWRLHSEMAGLFVRLGRLEDAASQLELARDCESPDASVAFDLGVVLAQMGRFADAASAVSRAICARPDEASFQTFKAELGDIIAGHRLALVEARFVATESRVIVDSDIITMPACIRYTNFQEVNPAFGRQHETQLYVERRRWLPDVRLCQLPAGTTLAVPNGDDFLPVTGQRVVAEQVRENWSYEDLTAAIESCTEQRAITQPCVLIGRYGIRTWGHWLGELLPKVVAVEARWPGRFCYGLPDRFAYDPAHDTAMQSLAYYGVSEDRLILLAPRTRYACSELHVVTSTWSKERVFHPAIAALMRERGPRDEEPAPGWLKAGLLRRATKTRNIVNLDEVEEILVHHGFTVVDIERLNFRQQVDLYKNADAIACVLGSGLTGLMYAPRGVKVLTMAPGEWGDLFFYSMMQERSAVFTDVRGWTVSADSAGAATSAFTVPAEPLLAGLAAIGIGPKIVAYEPIRAAEAERAGADS
nr:WcbI family polysaccharide biosynthesis putative acetyltransferase [uncultured Rhodopila sp.]